MLISNGHSYHDILNTYSISQVYAFYDTITRHELQKKYDFLGNLAVTIGSAISLQISSGSKKAYKSALKQWEKLIRFFTGKQKEIMNRTYKESKEDKAKKVLKQLLSFVPVIPQKKEDK